MAAEPSPASEVREWPAVRSEHTGAFLRLAQLWSRRSHFSLVLAAVDGPAYRDALIARLGEGASSAAPRIELGPQDPPQAWLTRLADARARGATHAHICLPLEPRRNAAWWQQANLLRERLADAFPGLQVVWLPDGDIDTAAHQAPDLWNWREAVLTFTASATASASRPALGADRPNVVQGADADAVRRRLAAIEHYLAGAEPADPGAAHLQLEAAEHYLWIDEWQKAAAAAQAASASLVTLGDEVGAASANSMAAEARWRLGQMEGVVERPDTARRVLQRLGHVSAAARVAGRLADVLQARGELDEALRIRREEELPVYEKLGDQREMLVCRANLAVGLFQRGKPGDRKTATDLLQQAHEAAVRLRLPEAGQIEQLSQQFVGRPILPATRKEGEG